MDIKEIEKYVVEVEIFKKIDKLILIKKIAIILTIISSFMTFVSALFILPFTIFAYIWIGISVEMDPFTLI